MTKGRLPLLCGLAAAAVLLGVLFASKVARKMPDLEVYWTAAGRARAAEPLYRLEDQHYQFKYLPAFAILTIPLGSVPLATAKAIWFAVSLLLVAAILALSLAVLPERRKPAWVLVVCTMVVMAKFYAHEIVLGQMNLLLGVVVLLALAELRRGREAAGGALASLAVVAKPYAVILLPWLAARLRPASMAAAALGLAGLLVLPALVYGLSGDIDLHRAWWRTVADSTAPNLTNQDNVSLAAMFVKWIGPGSTAVALAGAASLVLVAVIALVFARRRGLPFPESLEVGLLLTAIPLLSPQGWDYVFLLSTPAVMCLVNYEDRLPGPMRAAVLIALAAIGLSIYDVMGRAAYRTFMTLSIVTVCYLVVVIGLATLRVRRVA